MCQRSGGLTCPRAVSNLCFNHTCLFILQKTARDVNEQGRPNPLNHIQTLNFHVSLLSMHILNKSLEQFLFSILKQVPDGHVTAPNVFQIDAK